MDKVLEKEMYVYRFEGALCVRITNSEKRIYWEDIETTYINVEIQSKFGNIEVKAYVSLLDIY